MIQLRLSFFYSLKGLAFFSSMIISLVFFYSEQMILSVPFHMILVSFLYFVVPSLFLYSLTPFIPQKMAWTSLVSLVLFSIILTLQHAAFFTGMEIFSGPIVHWILLGLSIDAWRPFFIGLSKPNPHYMKWSLLAVTPACGILILVALFIPETSFATAYCLPEGVPLSALDTVLFHPKVDLIGSSLFMMVTHKCTLYVTNKGEVE
ncbi:hypothetical protein [Pontibacillus chungwhensis]|uniref:Uncharacterized protein n=2 Tax=Pontibacillus TaxID=289201 RepID=A0ABY8UTV3_9BACI|nr:hypothetical protein [Pontibacillus chungwhensis]MCD5323482.1 hypothetical protein [Pontibacillus sp. HN14]WIF96858.1 hypothetical protein QNI29_14000 [Pontibacillus chungwhensis]